MQRGSRILEVAGLLRGFVEGCCGGWLLGVSRAFAARDEATSRSAQGFCRFKSLQTASTIIPQRIIGDCLSSREDLKLGLLDEVISAATGVIEADSQRSTSNQADLGSRYRSPFCRLRVHRRLPMDSVSRTDSNFAAGNSRCRAVGCARARRCRHRLERAHQCTGG